MRFHWLWLLAALVLTGCGESYLGPLEDKPVEQVDLGNGQKRTITLSQRVLEQDVPQKPLLQAFRYFDQHRSLIRNRNWLSIIDFTQHSSQRRLYVIDLAHGLVDHLFVAHGIGSDPDDTGFAQKFSNEFNSLMSSLGFYLVAEEYMGRWGRAARLDGLDPTNSNARDRGVVLHGAEYVSEGRERMGRSEGCTSVDLKWIDTLVTRLQGDSLLYAYLEGM